MWVKCRWVKWEGKLSGWIEYVGVKFVGKVCE